MGNDDVVVAVGVVVLFGLGIFLGSFATYRIVDQGWKRDAVKQGHAFWKVDDDGLSTFHWKLAK